MTKRSRGWKQKFKNRMDRHLQQSTVYLRTLLRQTQRESALGKPLTQMLGKEIATRDEILFECWQEKEQLSEGLQAFLDNWKEDYDDIQRQMEEAKEDEGLEESSASAVNSPKEYPDSADKA